MKNVLITGATGFVGTALLTELAKLNYNITVLCRQDSRRRDRLAGFDGIKVVEVYLADADKLELHDEYDTFYHLAWEGGSNEFESQYRNIEIALKCLKLAKKCGCKRFICTGSQAEYGEVPRDTVITEETPLNPTTSYGTCKVAAYYLVRDLALRLEIDYIWVRIFSVYGSHDNPSSLLPQILQAKKESRTFTFITDGTHIWNYLHETDTAKGLIAIGECKTANTVFDLASKENMPLKSFIEKIYNNLTFGNEKSKVNLNVTIDKIVNVVGWKPERKFYEQD